MTTPSASGFDQARLRETIDAFRSSGTRAHTSEFDIPPDLATADAIQRSATLSGSIANAWKVAKSPTGIPVISRLHPFVSSAAEQALSWRPGMLLEIEIAVRLKQDLPPGPQYDRDDIVNASDAVFVGAELVRSVALENGKVSFPLFLADRMGNDGYHLGPAFSVSRLDQMQTGDLTILHGSHTLFAGRAKHANGDCLGWLIDFANLSTRDPQSLQGGAVVTTGSLCGAIALPSEGQIQVTVAPDITFRFSVLLPHTS
ncbi:2-keto-4-pentenoate hydratase [Neorhizobium sp. S3-V5DH]|uniref:2-keto-4-pentenoate hydratase n=1 Tax=Neorhizobium sp. S3-V5DH TaxID=2485166 RepID=UPI001043428A|nr:2-keto-4-pentenoate hydratase [Neorhizobium sp. S3-V5DH]TCV67426.1 hypothetical protein EDE09_11385 [Neorhizobium sp. S3-V5DH]